MNILPIEKNESLLIEYGRAFAWINRVEKLLNLSIIMGGKLYLIDKKIINSFFENKTLGVKINCAEKILSKEIKNNLRELNKKKNCFGSWIF